MRGRTTGGSLSLGPDGRDGRWSMGRWTNPAAREAIIAQAITMTLADFRRWFARHEASFLVD